MSGDCAVAGAGRGRVVIVDDDDIERLGRAWLARSVLADASVDVATTDEAMAWPDRRWAGTNMLLVSVRPQPRGWDRYVTLRAIRSASRASAAIRRVVALVPDIDDPLLRIRLARAGTDELFATSQLRCASSLSAMLDGQTIGAAPMPSAFELSIRGVGPDTDPDAVLQALACPDVRRAFGPAVSQATSGLSRRRIMRLRAQVAAAGDLLTPVLRSTGGPIRDTSLPTWREVVAYVNSARGAHLSPAVVSATTDVERSAWSNGQEVA